MAAKELSSDPILDLLTSINEQLKLLVRLQIAPVYAAMLSTPELQRLYKATGKKPIALLAKEFSMSAGKISAIWQRWEQAGLLRKSGKHYEQTV